MDDRGDYNSSPCTSYRRAKNKFSVGIADNDLQDGFMTRYDGNTVEKTKIPMDMSFFCLSVVVKKIILISKSNAGSLYPHIFHKEGSFYHPTLNELFFHKLLKIFSHIHLYAIFQVYKMFLNKIKSCFAKS